MIKEIQTWLKKVKTIQNIMLWNLIDPTPPKTLKWDFKNWQKLKEVTKK